MYLKFDQIPAKGNWDNKKIMCYILNFMCATGLGVRFVHALPPRSQVCKNFYTWSLVYKFVHQTSFSQIAMNYNDLHKILPIF